MELIKNLSDEALLSHYQTTQDKHCFELLVNRYQFRLYNTAFRVLGDAFEAEEIVQETFIRVFTSNDKYKVSTPLSAWLFTITHNLCKDLWRLKQRHLVYENLLYPSLHLHEQDDWGKQIADKVPGPAQQVETAEERAFILQSLALLPDNQKRVIILRHIEGLSYKEIADRTGIAIGTVRSRLFYGREKLKEALKK